MLVVLKYFEISLQMSKKVCLFEIYSSVVENNMLHLSQCYLYSVEIVLLYWPQALIVCSCILERGVITTSKVSGSLQSIV